MTAPTTEPCPVCKGKCCRDSYRYKLTHMGDEFYEHVCEACEDGTKYIALRTYEDGIAEGVRRERAAVVVWLRKKAVDWGADGSMDFAADNIEDGEHHDCRKEKAGARE